MAKKVSTRGGAAQTARVLQQLGRSHLLLLRLASGSDSGKRAYELLNDVLGSETPRTQVASDAGIGGAIQLGVMVGFTGLVFLYVHESFGANVHRRVLAGVIRKHWRRFRLKTIPDAGSGAQYVRRGGSPILGFDPSLDKTRNDCLLRHLRNAMGHHCWEYDPAQVSSSNLDLRIWDLNKRGKIQMDATIDAVDLARLAIDLLDAAHALAARKALGPPPP